MQINLNQPDNKMPILHNYLHGNDQTPGLSFHIFFKADGYRRAKRKKETRT